MTVIIKKSMHAEFMKWCVAILICAFTFPSLSFAEGPIKTYDRQSIRYPSMETGQVWARIGKNPSSNLNQESHIVKNGSTQDLEIKRFKTVPPRTSRATRKAGNQIAARPADKKETQKTSINKTVGLKKATLTETISSDLAKPKAGGENRRYEKDTNDAEMSQSDQSGKNWNYRQALYDSETLKSNQSGINWSYKQVLYDVDCSLKMSRVIVTYYFDKSNKLLRLKQSPDAKWYHIYPRSFEEELYTEICHPR